MKWWGRTVSWRKESHSCRRKSMSWWASIRNRRPLHPYWKAGQGARERKVGRASRKFLSRCIERRVYVCVRKCIMNLSNETFGLLFHPYIYSFLFSRFFFSVLVAGASRRSGPQERTQSGRTSTFDKTLFHFGCGRGRCRGKPERGSCQLECRQRHHPSIS